MKEFIHWREAYLLDCIPLASMNTAYGVFFADTKVFGRLTPFLVLLSLATVPLFRVERGV